MRVIQTYTFKMSPKTPYSDYPNIARRFLEGQNLVSHRFLYYFDENVFMKSCEETLITGGCAKAVRIALHWGKFEFIIILPLEAHRYSS